MSDGDILRLSGFWNITYHDCENNRDYRILKYLMRNYCKKSSLIMYNVLYGLYALYNLFNIQGIPYGSKIISSFII